MSSILYGNFRLEVSGRSGSQVDRLALRPPPGLVPRPRAATGSVPASPAGRDEQLDVVRRAVRAHQPVGFFGTCGYGKTTLLRYAAASVLAEGFAQPGVYLQAGPGGLRDLLHRLVGELYTADEPVKLPPDQCAEVLGQVHALVAADDVALIPGQADYLRTVLPGCSLLLSSRHPVLGQDDSHELGGLPEEAALQLVIDDLGRPLTPGEMADVRRLTAAVDGQPLHLRQVTALVREGGQSFAALAERAERDPEALDRLSVGALAERYRQGLAILALAAGALLPIDLVSAMSGIAEISECLSLLCRRGLAEQEGDRFGLPVCKAERYREMLAKDVHHAAALRELTSWLTTANPATPDSICAASAALAIAEWAAEGSDWAGVVEVVRVAEPILTLAGHWEASRRALTAGLHAAAAVGNHLGEALFAHQQGTLALCLDELTSARQLLTHALRLREQHDDPVGAAITRHNLEVLQPSAPKPGKPQSPRSLRKLLAVAGSGAIAVLAITAGVVKALPSSPTSTPSPTSSPSSTIEHHHHHHGKLTGSGTSDGGNTGGGQGNGGATPPPPPPPLKPPVLQPVNFGSLDITQGQQPVQVVTARNPNTRPLTITGAQTTSPYSVTADSCQAHLILPQGICTISVQFKPSALGQDSENLSVTSTGGPSSTTINGSVYAVLTVTITGNGSGTVSDNNAINCPGSCSEKVTAPVTLTPTAEPGSNFIAWGDTCPISGNQVAPLEDCTVSADFEPIEPSARIGGRVHGVSHRRLRPPVVVATAGRMDDFEGGQRSCPSTAAGGIGLRDRQRRRPGGSCPGERA